MQILGIGTDIIQNHRLSKNEKVILKFLAIKEYDIYLSLSHHQRNEFISGRWAAKEAIIKATNKKYMFSQISIINNKFGKPEVFIDNIQSEKIIISISHEKKYTIAFAIVIE